MSCFHPLILRQTFLTYCNTPTNPYKSSTYSIFVLLACFSNPNKACKSLIYKARFVSVFSGAT